MASFSFVLNIGAANSGLRNPSAFDDASRGNIVGRLWLNRTTGEFFTCSDTSHRAAVWASAGTPTALPGDAVASVTACYGTKPLKTSWANGNLFKVQRKSNNDQQIIAAINGVADIATLNSFLAGTVGQVIIWYDQSGNGNDAAQTVIANAPWIRVVGTEIKIVYDRYCSPSATALWLDMPAVAWGTDFTQFAFAAATSQRHGAIALWELGADTSNYQGLYNGQFGNWNCAIGTVAGVANFSIDTSPAIWSMKSTSTVAKVWCQERVYDPGSNWHTKGSPVGGRIGKSVQASGYYFDGSCDAFLVWSSALSDANALLVRKALYQSFGYVPQADNDFIVLDGDSDLNADYCTFPSSGSIPNLTGPKGYSVTVQMLASLNRPCRMLNMARSGYRVLDGSVRYTADIKPLFNSANRNNILVIQSGLNDPYVDGDTSTPTIVYNRVATYCTAANGDGFTVLYVNGPSISNQGGALTGGNTALDTWTVSFNALLAANLPTGCAAIIDVASNPLWAPNGTNFATDQYEDHLYHYTASAQGAHVPYYANPINVLLGLS